MSHRRHIACGVYSPPIVTHRSRSSRPVPPPLAHPTSSSEPPTPWYSPFVTSTTTTAAATCGTRQSTVPTPLHARTPPPPRRPHPRRNAAPTHHERAHAGDDPHPVHQDNASLIGTCDGRQTSCRYAQIRRGGHAEVDPTRTPTLSGQQRRRRLPGNVPSQHQTGDEGDPHDLRRVRKTIIRHTPVG